MAQLPQEFLTRMQDMLGDEFDAFLTSYDAPRTAGLRVNTKKCRTEDFRRLFRERGRKFRGFQTAISCRTACAWASLRCMRQASSICRSQAP